MTYREKARNTNILMQSNEEKAVLMTKEYALIIFL